MIFENLNKALPEEQNCIEMDDIEIHLPHQQNQQQIMNHIPQHLQQNALPVMTAQQKMMCSMPFLIDVKPEIASGSHSDDIEMEEKKFYNTPLADNLVCTISEMGSSQNPHYYHYRQHRLSRHSNYRTLLRSGITGIAASKPIDIGMPKSPTPRNELIEQTSTLHYNSAPTCFRRTSPLGIAQLNRSECDQKVKIQNNESSLMLATEVLPKIIPTEPSTAATMFEKSEEETIVKQQTKRHLQYKLYQQYQQPQKPKIILPTIRKATFNDQAVSQPASKPIQNMNLSNFRKYSLNETIRRRINECNDLLLHESNKENNHGKFLNNLKSAVGNFPNEKRVSKDSSALESSSAMNCDDDFFDDDSSIISCDEENNSLNGEVAQNKFTDDFWTMNANDFPTLPQFFSVGDIIGYSKVVRAERNEALGQLNDAIGRFSIEWPKIRKGWEHNLRIGQLRATVMEAVTPPAGMA